MNKVILIGICIFLVFLVGCSEDSDKTVVVTGNGDFDDNWRVRGNITLSEEQPSKELECEEDYNCEDIYSDYWRSEISCINNTCIDLREDCYILMKKNINISDEWGNCLVGKNHRCYCEYYYELPYHADILMENEEIIIYENVTQEGTIEKGYIKFTIKDEYLEKKYG